MPKRPRSTQDDLFIYIYEKGHVRAKRVRVKKTK